MSKNNEFRLYSRVKPLKYKRNGPQEKFQEEGQERKLPERMLT